MPDLIWKDSDSDVFKCRLHGKIVTDSKAECLRDSIEQLKHEGNHINWYSQFNKEFKRTMIYGYTHEEAQGQMRFNSAGWGRFECGLYWKRRNRGMQREKCNA